MTGTPPLRAGRPARLRWMLWLSIAAAAFLYWRYNSARPYPERLALPAGFTVTVFASEVENARSLALGDRGTVFVGSRDAGNVYALPDTNRDGVADRVITLAAGLQMPNGVAFRDGALYVAEVSRILRFDSIETRLDDPTLPVVTYADFPRDEQHGWKYIRFGPDGFLYVPVGAPCNVCRVIADRYAAIFRMRPDGSEQTVFATGVRNTVGFDWHPQTGQFWFSDNGRDMLGEDLPPDELNVAATAGLDFGFPKCFGNEVVDPDFGIEGDCAASVPPVVEFPAHVAPLGLQFYTGGRFPDAYKDALFVAEHGSWNRSTPVGFRLTAVHLGPSEEVTTEVFADGWLGGRRAWGRPVDLLVAPDGALLVSDDLADVIYRISYTGQSEPTGTTGARTRVPGPASSSAALPEADAPVHGLEVEHTTAAADRS